MKGELRESLVSLDVKHLKDNLYLVEINIRGMKYRYYEKSSNDDFSHLIIEAVNSAYKKRRAQNLIYG